MFLCLEVFIKSGKVKKISKYITDIFVEGFFRRWYRFVNSADKNAEVVFMNYGFTDGSREIPLDEKN